ncbi:MAG: hypothetical protein DI555_06950 [Novosphingobium pentaromativorans]|uniref:Uncharacterized protein n=1 Tax=Novosphingobium pentaromativorans TaxID=205844 RepID=A0A2W5NTR6_9SPHN|nr:MAG: hypothetical protein DI555_06950 [Novosphingobium pentaromativorans]
MKVSERDLYPDADPECFGTAASKCEGFTPDCSFHGRCMNGGDCFASPAHLVAARMVESLLPKDGRAGLHLAYLRRVAEMLREDRVHL